MDSPVKPLREHTIRQGAHISKKDATILPTPRVGGSGLDQGWVGGGLEGGQKVAFGGFCLALSNASKRLKMRPFAPKFSTVHFRFGRETNWGGGGWLGKCEKWIEKWLRVDRGAANQGVTSTTLGKSQRFRGLSGHEPPSRMAQLVAVDTVKQIERLEREPFRANSGCIGWLFQNATRRTKGRISTTA